jgi:adenylate kinase family enzyme
MALALPFKHPFTGVCSGPTGSGKSELMKKIIMHSDQLVHPPPERIVWYYAEYQPKLNSELGEKVQFREGCPDLSEFKDDSRTLVVIDDLMSECGSEITKLFTKGSHHRNLSVWFLMQNFFHQAKEIRTITLNAHYIILFKNPRDKQQVKVLARQMYDTDSAVMERAFSEATERPHGYLLIDLKQDTPDHLRLRSNIIPGERLEIYTSKKTFKEDRIELYHNILRS